ncbi:MAG: type II secretion system protein [Patescibacteria group bacterium]
MKKGFTMIELLVAIGLFIVVISVSSGIFIKSLRTQRQIVSLMAANDNASLALEQIIREIRTGRDFSSGKSQLSFTNYLEESVVYELDSNSIKRNGKSITASNVNVVYFNISLLGERLNDGRSTRVTISLGISAKGALESFVTNLQTTVSARTIDS